MGLVFGLGLFSFCMIDRASRVAGWVTGVPGFDSHSVKVRLALYFAARYLKLAAGILRGLSVASLLCVGCHTCPPSSGAWVGAMTGGGQSSSQVAGICV